MIQGGGFAPGMSQKPTDAPINNEANNGLKNNKYTLAMGDTQFVQAMEQRTQMHLKPARRGRPVSKKMAA
jgi:cyclophilin family peptidyl-prolyl cis-trans isomerase